MTSERFTLRFIRSFHDICIATPPKHAYAGASVIEFIKGKRTIAITLMHGSELPKK
jgi:hypothetical protein